MSATNRHDRQTAGTEGYSLVQLLKQLRDETSLLMRQEFALAKAEVTEKGKALARHAAYLAAGAALAYAGFLFVLLALTFAVMVGLTALGISQAISSWLAALIVGLAVLAAAYGLARKGASLFKHRRALPVKTVESLRESKQWLKHKLT
jgi:hypothetical protein